MPSHWRRAIGNSLLAAFSVFAVIPGACALEGSSSSGGASVSSASSDGKTNCYEAGNLVEEAIKAGTQGEREEALYRKAGSLCPAMAEASFNLGVLLGKRGDFEGARSSLEKAIQIRNDPHFRIELGNLFSRSSKDEDAEREFRRVLDENPKQPKALQGMALLLAKKGETGKALDFLERAKTIDESDPVTWFNLAVLYDRANQLEAAVQAFEKAAVLSPKDGSIQLFLGRSLRRLGDADGSRRALERAAQLSPDEASVQVALGAVYDSEGDPERAERALRRAVESDPKNSTAWVNLALVQLDGGRAEDSVRSARAAVERAQQAPPEMNSLQRDEMLCRANAVLGWGLLELGRLAEADDAISRGLELAESSQSSALRAAAYSSAAALKERQGRPEEAKRNRAEARALVPSIDASADKGWRVWR